MHFLSGPQTLRVLKYRPRYNWRCAPITSKSSTMTKKCIICHQAAGSREHVFPASFGGRRINRGIYCKKDNNDFGRHVTALLEGVDIVNALMGVVPDQKKEVRPALATSAGGERFFVSAAHVTLAPPPSVDETPELVGKEVQLAFANEEQAREWIEKQESAGYKVSTSAFSPPQTKFFGEALHARRRLGGEDFMRGLLYLALTFVAHNAPGLARSEGLAEVRDIVENDGAVLDRVFWELPSTAGQISKSPFTHGHTVVTGPDASGKRVVALVSLYGTMHFGIDLGDLAPGNFLERVTTHIDPLAPHPPNDIKVIRERAALALSTIDESKAYLTKLRAGEVDPLSDVLRDASDRELLEASRTLLTEVQKLSSLSHEDQITEVLALLSAHGQRIFNWMRSGFIDFSKSEPKLSDAMCLELQNFVALDESAPRGLAEKSEAALQMAQAVLTEQIVAALKRGTLDEKQLASLIGGGADGLGTVLEFFVLLIAKQMPR